MTTSHAGEPGDAPQSERAATVLFESLGREGVEARLNELSAEADRRLNESYERCGTMPPGFTGLNFLTPSERNDRYLLQLALMLHTDPQAEARARIAQRIEARRRARRPTASEAVLSR